MRNAVAELFHGKTSQQISTYQSRKKAAHERSLFQKFVGAVLESLGNVLENYIYKSKNYNFRKAKLIDKIEKHK